MKYQVNLLIKNQNNKIVPVIYDYFYFDHENICPAISEVLKNIPDIESEVVSVHIIKIEEKIVEEIVHGEINER